MISNSQNEQDPIRIDHNNLQQISFSCFYLGSKFNTNLLRLLKLFRILWKLKWTLECIGVLSGDTFRLPFRFQSKKFSESKSIIIGWVYGIFFSNQISTYLSPPIIRIINPWAIFLESALHLVAFRKRFLLIIEEMTWSRSGKKWTKGFSIMISVRE